MEVDIPYPSVPPCVLTEYQFDLACKLLKIEDRDSFKKDWNIVIDKRIQTLELSGMSNG